MIDPVGDDGPQKPGDSYVQSFARGLAVIRSFSSGAPSQTMAEVAEATGLTRAGARRILHTLQGLGYVEVEGRQYRLTPKVLDLGFAYLSSLPFWNLAEPCMEELVRSVQESCSAAVLEGTEIVYVLRVPTSKIMTISLGVGSRLPAYCTSMGRVLLSALSEDELSARLRHSRLAANTPHTVAEIPKLLQIIADVRENGYALVEEELESGLISLAVPLRGHHDRVLAAINVSCHTRRTTAHGMRTDFLPKLLATADEISHRLRHARR